MAASHGTVSSSTWVDVLNFFVNFFEVQMVLLKS